jgi:hypothetical protein
VRRLDEATAPDVQGDVTGVGGSAVGADAEDQVAGLQVVDGHGYTEAELFAGGAGQSDPCAGVGTLSHAGTVALSEVRSTTRHATRRLTRKGASRLGHWRCILRLHKWQQKPDPRGYSGGPATIYSVCWRCEKEKWTRLSRGSGPSGGYSGSGSDGGGFNPGP